MPYKLSEDGKAVMVLKNGKWKVKKRYTNKQEARRYLTALNMNVREAKDG